MLISRHNLQPNTLTRQEYSTKVKFMSRILEKIHVVFEKGSGSETNWKAGSGSLKNPCGSTTLPMCNMPEVHFLKCFNIILNDRHKIRTLFAPHRSK
jgi:hypothetical protein